MTVCVQCGASLRGRNAITYHNAGTGMSAVFCSRHCKFGFIDCLLDKHFARSVRRRYYNQQLASATDLPANESIDECVMRRRECSCCTTGMRDGCGDCV